MFIPFKYKCVDDYLWSRALVEFRFQVCHFFVIFASKRDCDSRCDLFPSF